MSFNRTVTPASVVGSGTDCAEAGAGARLASKIELISAGDIGPCGTKLAPFTAALTRAARLHVDISISDIDYRL